MVLGRGLLATAVALVVLWVAAPAAAQTTAAEAIAAAEKTQAVAAERERHPEVKPAAARNRDGSVDVEYLHDLDRGTTVTVGPDGAVRDIWTGYAAGWGLARGRHGEVGGRLTEPAVLIILAVAFLVPFADRRRLLSLRNLDLAALLFLCIPLLLFDHGRIVAAMILSYPSLAYLCARMIAIGAGRGRGSGPVHNIPLRVLALAIPVLCAFRIVLDLTSPLQLDVGYFSLIGADHLAHGDAIYNHMPYGGDHYGPLAYAAYAPFEALMPYTGQRDPAAAHWTGILVDLLMVPLLYVVGRQLGGRKLAVLLPYAWLSLPLTAVALCTHANDGLVALLLVALVAIIARPVLSGMLLSAAAMTKAAPLALVPLAALHPGIAVVRPRRIALFAAGFLVVLAVSVAPILVHTSPGDFVRATFLWESANHTPFSLWGLLDPTAKSYWVYLVQSLVRAGALILAIVVAVRPPMRSRIQLCALAAAVLIALQLSANYWLFTYVSWFAPLLLIAWLAAPTLTATARPGPSAAERHAGAGRGLPTQAPDRARRSS